MLSAMINSATAAPLHVSNTLGSNMVLQRDAPAPIWGWADAGTLVSVQLEGSSGVYEDTAGFDGRWRAEVTAQRANLVGRTITISAGAEEVELTNVLFGDVVMCSGQSNMEFVLSRALNHTAEVAAADAYPHIRVFDGAQQNVDSLHAPRAPINVTHDELFYVRMNWSVASSKTVGPGSDNCCRRRLGDADDSGGYAQSDDSGGYDTLDPAPSGFSAVCWLAAKRLADMHGGKVPIGAIDQSYGGTSIQFWMSADAIKASDAPVATQCCGQDGGPSCLWNTQIYPCVPRSCRARDCPLSLRAANQHLQSRHRASAPVTQPVLAELARHNARRARARAARRRRRRYTLGPTQLFGVLWYQGEQNANCGGPTQTGGAVYSTMLQAGRSRGMIDRTLANVARPPRLTKTRA